MYTAKMVTAVLLLVFGGLFSGCSYRPGRGWKLHPVESFIEGVAETALEKNNETGTLGQ